MTTATRYIEPGTGDHRMNRVIRLGSSATASAWPAPGCCRPCRTSARCGPPSSTCSSWTATATVAPRGCTQWVRNLRAAGAGELRVGRPDRVLPGPRSGDADKGPVLRAYLDRWAGGRPLLREPRRGKRRRGRGRRRPGFPCSASRPGG